MDLISIILLGVGLAMDAFSVSITLGITLKNFELKHALWIALFFGAFQAIMPILGWISGMQLQSLVSALAPWIAFLLLLGIGLKMIYESFKMKEEDANSLKVFSFKELLLLAIATSIDAFAVGITFAFLEISIWIPVLIIGIITFILSFIGVYIGKRIGHLFERKIEIFGGLILIGIGLKILLEYLLS
jgi:putative Mn2+ efflux pump MntP